MRTRFTTQFRNPRSARGIALVIVLISITVLAVLAGGFAFSMKVENKLARNSNSEAQLEWLGRSGVEYARWILAEQVKIPSEPYDALNQVWAGGPGGFGITNSPLMDVQKEVHLGNGRFTWKITDLERRANINTATEPILQQALMVAGVDPAEMTPVVSSILDWIDPDNNVHMQGAEDDYYQSLTPPYSTKNGPLDDLAELMMIKGVTPEIFWGSASTNHPPAAFLHRSGRSFNRSEASPYQVGLFELFTPISGGKININTASATVLQLIPGVDRVVADAIVAGREGEDDGSGLMGPYRDVSQIGRMPEVNPMLLRQIQQYCDVRSFTFLVEVDASVGSYKRTFVGVIARPRGNARDLQILSFHWK